MRPLTVLVGIIMGSTVAMALGLAMVLIIFLILADEHAQLRNEFGPLLKSVLLFTVVAAAAAFSFVGQLRHASWRRQALAVMWTALLVAVWIYWPRPA